MAQAIDSGSGGGAPFVKFNECGDTLVAAFAGGKSRQQQDFKTKELKFKDNGKPLLEEVMHLVAMPGTTARTGEADSPQPIDDGAHVRFSVAGWKWGMVIDARKALPPYAGFPAGQSCSGDVYTITLVGWSAETENAAAATKAGFTVIDGRIVMRSREDKQRYVLAQSDRGGNTNPAKDYEITVRRPTADEKRWEQAADELYATKPWERATASVGGASSDDDADDMKPF